MSNPRRKVCCVKCTQEISLSNIERHYKSCTGNIKIKPQTIIYPDDLKCRFCSRELNSKISFVTHERLCINNPNKQEHPKGMLGKKGKNQYTKSKRIRIT